MAGDLAVEDIVDVHVNSLALGAQICIGVFLVSAYRRTPREQQKTKLPFVVLNFVLTALFLLHAVCVSFFQSDVLALPENSSELVFTTSKRQATRNAVDTSSQVFLSFVGNGILLYRCYMVMRDKLWILVLPVLMYLVSLVMGVLCIVSGISILDYIHLGALKGATIFQLSWFLLSVAVNVSVTAIISFKILSSQRTLAKSLSKEHVRTYNNIILILTESSLPFTLLGIAASVVVGLNQTNIVDSEQSLSNAWYAFCALSPQLIIFRVVTDRAWAKDLQTATSDMAISQPIAFGGRDQRRHRDGVEETEDDSDSSGY